MTPEQLIKREILLSIKTECDSTENDLLLSDIRKNNVDKLWEFCLDEYGFFHSYCTELFRYSGEITNLKPQHDSYYSSRAKARQLKSGEYVGWTEFYGGGKHGQPEDVEWMSKAYFVTCEEKVKVVKEFTQVGSVLSK